MAVSGGDCGKSCSTCIFQKSHLRYTDRNRASVPEKFPIFNDVFQILSEHLCVLCVSECEAKVAVAVKTKKELIVVQRKPAIILIV